MAAYPVLLIALGVLVLLLGKRLAVLGAAVGALVGMGLMQLFSVQADPLFNILIIGAFAVGGFFLTGFAKGIINIVLVILCALGGAAIVLGFLDIFNVMTTWVQWAGALVGGLAGWMLYRRFSDMALVVLAGVVGALLVMRGLTTLMPSLEGGFLETVLVIVLAGLGIGVQGGIFAKRKAAAEAKAQAAAAEAAAAPTPVATPAPVVVDTPAPAAPAPAAAAPAPSSDTGAAPPAPTA